MNDGLNPEITRESHIFEIKKRKEKKQKAAFPVRAFIIILAVSVVTSALSGAGGAFLMFGFLRNMTVSDLNIFLGYIPRSEFVSLKIYTIKDLEHIAKLFFGKFISVEQYLKVPIYPTV